MKTAGNSIGVEVMIIALIDFNNSSDVRWEFGPRLVAGKSVKEINEQITELKEFANYILFFNTKHEMPDREALTNIAQSRGDMWHGGRAGNGSGFSLLSYIKPCWMLNLSPERNIEFVSWKINCQSALVPVHLFERYGALTEGFVSLDAAFFEWGYRFISQGGIPIYKPRLAKGDTGSAFDTKDQVHFLKLFFTVFWIRWALWRALSSGDISVSEFLNYWWEKPLKVNQVDLHRVGKSILERRVTVPSISVVIITLNRYRYLKSVVRQLSQQTVPIAEIIVVDASPSSTREVHWISEVSDLNINLKVLNSEIIGQCTQRNMAIKNAVGELIYFCDDDMEEILPDHLERHLKNMTNYRADASCGFPDEVGVTPINREKLQPLVSSVFPTNDSLVFRFILYDAGLFDTKMDRGQNEDHDLGTRIFLAGGIMILDPAIKSVHLRAASGGLRQHGARVITATLSKRSFVRFRILHHSELYSDLKYFSLKNVKELMIISIFATFRMNGSLIKRIFKLFMAIVYLPSHYMKLRKRYKIANTLIELK